jgi:hypothetical protein
MNNVSKMTAVLSVALCVQSAVIEANPLSRLMGRAMDKANYTSMIFSTIGAIAAFDKTAALAHNYVPRERYVTGATAVLTGAGVGFFGGAWSAVKCAEVIEAVGAKFPKLAASVNPVTLDKRVAATIVIGGLGGAIAKENFGNGDMK